MYKQYFVYILTNQIRGSLYIGVTSQLKVRIYQHKNNLVEGFTKRYHMHNLVYYEIFNDSETAIRREKQLKNWKRIWKVELIEKVNPTWIDLYEEI